MRRMNWDRAKGYWRQAKGIAWQQWGWMTANESGVRAGKRERLIGKILAAQGVSTEADEKQLAEWLAREHKTDPIHK
jgi:uncharacterized protein YjbJ (UPF0337 family)